MYTVNYSFTKRNTSRSEQRGKIFTESDNVAKGKTFFSG